MLTFNIKAFNTYLPKQYCITSEKFDAMLGLPVGTTENRSAITSRYIFPKEVQQSDAMKNCIVEMCEKYNLSKDNIDLILCANAVPEQALPNTSSAVIQKLGLNITGLDINMSCLTFISAMQTALSLLATKQYRNIVIANCDMPHKCLNYNDPESSYIFGDGCSAIWLSSENGNINEISLLDTSLKTFAQYRDSCQIKIGGTLHNLSTGYNVEDFYFKMDGKKLFKAILQNIESFMEEFFLKNKITKEQIKYVIGHQASHLGMSHMIKKLGFKEEQIINIYSEHGNQVGSSLPTVLNTMLSKNNCQKGDKVLFLGTGAGLTIGAALWHM